MNMEKSPNGELAPSAPDQSLLPDNVITKEVEMNTFASPMDPIEVNEKDKDKRTIHHHHHHHDTCCWYCSCPQSHNSSSSDCCGDQECCGECCGDECCSGCGDFDCGNCCTDGIFDICFGILCCCLAD